MFNENYLQYKNRKIKKLKYGENNLIPISHQFPVLILFAYIRGQTQKPGLIYLCTSVVVFLEISKHLVVNIIQISFFPFFASSFSSNLWQWFISIFEKWIKCLCCRWKKALKFSINIDFIVLAFLLNNAKINHLSFGSSFIFMLGLCLFNLPSKFTFSGKSLITV